MTTIAVRAIHPEALGYFAGGRSVLAAAHASPKRDQVSATLLTVGEVLPRAGIQADFERTTSAAVDVANAKLTALPTTLRKKFA
jgi:hypothetical protein